MIDPDRRIAGDWLALRRAADAEARGRSLWLVGEVAALRPVAAVDVGAGTGANHAYLAPLLPGVTWILLDHDPDLLDAAAPGVRRVVGGVEALGDLAGDLARPLLVTCSALLDLLHPDQLAGLADALAADGVVGLFALTVDGSFELAPPHPGDASLTSAFNAHQRRHGDAGPDAAAHLARLCRARGLAVEEVATPWRLDARKAPMVARLVRERAAAAAVAEPARAAEFGAWLDQRLAQLGAQVLSVEVGHRDLLVRRPA